VLSPVRPVDSSAALRNEKKKAGMKRKRSGKKEKKK
jgi:hypothetical protein